MKRSELAFTAILVPLDYVLVFLAALTAHSVRFGIFAAYRPATQIFEMRQFMGLAALVAGVFVLCFALAGLYGVSGARQLKSEVSRILLASSTAIMTVIVLIFFNQTYFASRFIVLAAWALAFLYVAAGRVIVRFAQRILLRWGIGTRRVAILGGEDRTTTLLHGEFAKNPAMGYQVVKRAAAFDAPLEGELTAMAAGGELDEVIVTDPSMRREELSAVLGFCQAHHVTFKYSADLLATHAKNIDIGAIAGIPIVEIKGTRLDGWGRIFKRTFDVIVSLLLIAVTSPIMLLAAVAIKLDSRGPVLFSRLDDGSPVMRVGEAGKPFRYFKFRSMRPKSHDMRYDALAHLNERGDGPLVKIKDDPRVTRVGTFIRKWSIDELPELFLVLAGSMSLVGPRPHMPEEVAKYDDRQRRVLTIKPGITGMAQVSGRAELTFDEEVRLDTYYVENWTPMLDLIILLRTPLVVLTKKGAS